MFAVYDGTGYLYHRRCGRRQNYFASGVHFCVERAYLTLERVTHALGTFIDGTKARAPVRPATHRKEACFIFLLACYCGVLLNMMQCGPVKWDVLAELGEEQEETVSAPKHAKQSQRSLFAGFVIAGTGEKGICNPCS